MRVLFIVLFSSVVLFGQYDTLTNTYPDGTLKESFPRYEKRVEGVARFYYPTGKLREERTYAAGKVEGLVKQYDSLGRLQVTFSIESGKREGPCTYFAADGSVAKEVFYVNGIVDIPDTSGITEEDIESAETVAPPPAAVQDAPNVERQITPQPLRPVLTENNPAPADTIAPMLGRDTLFVDLTIANNALLTRLSTPPAPRIGWKALQDKIAYPDYARKKGITGTVKILAYLNTAGDVVKEEIVKPLGYGCDDAAQIAVHYTRFWPAAVNGVVKPSVILLEINFQPPVP